MKNPYQALPTKSSMKKLAKDFRPIRDKIRDALEKQPKHITLEEARAQIKKFKGTKTLEERLVELSARGTLRICCRTAGKGFQVTGYAGNPVPREFDLRGESLEGLITIAENIQTEDGESDRKLKRLAEKPSSALQGDALQTLKAIASHKSYTPTNPAEETLVEIIHLARNATKQKRRGK